MLHVPDRLVGIGCLERYILDPRRNKIYLLHVAVGEVGIFQDGHDESRIIKIGACEGALTDSRTVEVDVDEFGILETRINDICIAERTEFRVDSREIAGFNRNPIKKAQSEHRSREKAVPEGSSRKRAASKFLARKILSFEGDSRETEILDAVNRANSER